MRKLFLLSTLMIFGISCLYAQPANDDCTNAIFIPEVSGWCSERGEYTNADATPTNWVNDPPTCHSGAHNDVWFTFIAGATDVTIIVRGNTSTAAGGTLNRPEVTLFSGDCNNFNELECTTDLTGSHIVELYKGGLIVGQTYIIQVQGRNQNEGTFQLCVNNYNAPTEPQSDCPTASVLCDKSPFAVQAVTGAGSDRREMDDALCFTGGAAAINIESNSTWFTWICDESGTLEFDLVPLSEEDDLDFVVYELPNGVADCSGKQILRCMASGDFLYPSPCMGPTGLRAGSNDSFENAGCNGPGDDNYLQPVNMVAGRAYALVINNFTSQGNGFSIEFGGTGTFRGPDAEFVVELEFGSNDNVICANENLVVTDISQFPLGSIEAWEWTFGVGAQPATASGIGPHSVRYVSGGFKSVVLTVETDLGCEVTEITTFEVLPAVEAAPQLTLPSCGGGADGEIVLDVSGGQTPYEFSWQGADFEQGENTLDSLVEGDYTVQIVDNQGCTADLTIELREPGLALDSRLEPFIPPSCFGFQDGQISITAAEGTPPYEFDFGNGFTPDNTLSNLGIGTYTVEVRDVVGCDETFEITVTQPDSLTLETTTSDISCFGQIDGAAEIVASGGVGDYMYNWSNNSSSPSINNLEIGTYGVTVTDLNGCEAIEEVIINEPAGIDFRLNGVIDALCFEEASGSAQVEALGGSPPFEYSADGRNFQTSPNLENLLAGTYTLVVRDNRGCLGTLEATIGEPEPFFVDAGPDAVIDLGFSTPLNATTNPPELPVEIEWSETSTLDCENCPDPTASPFNTTDYTITIRDENGCETDDEVRVEVRKIRPVYEPNVFSPTSEISGNNRFSLYAGPAASVINTLKIYDRWGELVYEGFDLPHSDSTVGWDGTYRGKPMNPGVFVYYAEILFIDGETRLYEGDLTLIR